MRGYLISWIPYFLVSLDVLNLPLTRLDDFTDNSYRRSADSHRRRVRSTILYMNANTG
jgi:hypothetical protein